MHDYICYRLAGGDRELKSMILTMVNGANQTPLSTKPTHHQQHHPNIIAPNLSSCHASLTDANRRVYCCPPYSPDDPILDFQFPDPSTTPLRVRRPAHKLTPEFIRNYANAIDAMRSLPPSDPRSFLRQADLHCLFCTGAYDHLDLSPAAAAADRLPGIIKIHRSWLFMPWHRMLLYFHERILGSLIGDPAFALPYWNWDAPEGMVIPEMHMFPPFADSERDPAHLPPSTADDNYDYDESHSGEDLIQSNLALLYHQMVSGARKPELFHGCPYKAGPDGACDGAGTIELAPHNPLHTWVGSNLRPEREDLGAFYTAGKDPLFYAHHSNVDRMWDLWQRSRGCEPEITDPDWLDSYFFFYDENLKLVRIKIRDVLNITKLRYTYEHADLPWLNAKPKPSVPPKNAKHALNMRENKENQNRPGRLRLATHLSTHFGSKGRTLHDMVRIKVKRPRICRSEREKAEEEEVLVVYGIKVLIDKYAKFDVFVNAVNETGLGPRAREFAGTFVNGRMGAARAGVNEIMERKTKLKVGITELLEDLEADCDNFIWVSLVPRCAMGDYISIEGVSIEFMR